MPGLEDQAQSLERRVQEQMRRAADVVSRARKVTERHAQRSAAGTAPSTPSVSISIPSGSGLPQSSNPQAAVETTPKGFVLEDLGASPHVFDDDDVAALPPTEQLMQTPDSPPKPSTAAQPSAGDSMLSQTTPAKHVHLRLSQLQGTRETVSMPELTSLSFQSSSSATAGIDGARLARMRAKVVKEQDEALRQRWEGDQKQRETDALEERKVRRLQMFKTHAKALSTEEMEKKLREMEDDYVSNKKRKTVLFEKWFKSMQYAIQKARVSVERAEQEMENYRREEDETREQLTARIHEMQKETSEQSIRVRVLEGQVDDRQRRSEELNRDIVELRQRHTERATSVATEMAVWHEKRTRLQQMAADKKAAFERNRQQQSDLLDTLRKKIAAIEGELSQCQRQYREVNVVLERAVNSRGELQQRDTVKFLSQVEAVERRLFDAKSHRENVSSDLQAAVDRLQDLESRRSLLQEHVDELQRALQRVVDKTEALRDGNELDFRRAHVQHKFDQASAAHETTEERIVQQSATLNEELKGVVDTLAARQEERDQESAVYKARLQKERKRRRMYAVNRNKLAVYLQQKEQTLYGDKAPARIVDIEVDLLGDTAPAARHPTSSGSTDAAPNAAPNPAPKPPAAADEPPKPPSRAPPAPPPPPPSAPPAPPAPPPPPIAPPAPKPPTAAAEKSGETLEPESGSAGAEAGETDDNAAVVETGDEEGAEKATEAVVPWERQVQMLARQVKMVEMEEERYLAMWNKGFAALREKHLGVDKTMSDARSEFSTLAKLLFGTRKRGQPIFGKADAAPLVQYPPCSPFVRKLAEDLVAGVDKQTLFLELVDELARVMSGELRAVLNHRSEKRRALLQHQDNVQQLQTSLLASSTGEEASDLHERLRRLQSATSELSAEVGVSMKAEPTAVVKALQMKLGAVRDDVRSLCARYVQQYETHLQSPSMTHRERDYISRLQRLVELMQAMTTSFEEFRNTRIAVENRVLERELFCRVLGDWKTAVAQKVQANGVLWQAKTLAEQQSTAVTDDTGGGAAEEKATLEKVVAELSSLLALKDKEHEAACAAWERVAQREKRDEAEFAGFQELMRERIAKLEAMLTLLKRQRRSNDEALRAHEQRKFAELDRIQAAGDDLARQQVDRLLEQRTREGRLHESGLRDEMKRVQDTYVQECKARSAELLELIVRAKRLESELEDARQMMFDVHARVDSATAEVSELEGTVEVADAAVAELEEEERAVQASQPSHLRVTGASGSMPTSEETVLTERRKLLEHKQRALQKELNDVRVKRVAADEKLRMVSEQIDDIIQVYAADLRRANAAWEELDVQYKALTKDFNQREQALSAELQHTEADWRNLDLERNKLIHAAKHGAKNQEELQAATNADGTYRKEELVSWEKRLRARKAQLDRLQKEADDGAKRFRDTVIQDLKEFSDAQRRVIAQMQKHRVNVTRQAQTLEKELEDTGVMAMRRFSVVQPVAGVPESSYGSVDEADEANRVDSFVTDLKEAVSGKHSSFNTADDDGNINDDDDGDDGDGSEASSPPKLVLDVSSRRPGVSAMSESSTTNTSMQLVYPSEVALYGPQKPPVSRPEIERMHQAISFLREGSLVYKRSNNPRLPQIVLCGSRLPIAERRLQLSSDLSRLELFASGRRSSESFVRLMEIEGVKARGPKAEADIRPKEGETFMFTILKRGNRMDLMVTDAAVRKEWIASLRLLLEHRQSVFYIRYHLSRIEAGVMD